MHNFEFRNTPYYIGDDTRFKEVLINILSNAVKFTDAPGSIRMTVERTAVFENQSTLRFCIRDTGIGIDKDFIPRIFDAFSQEDSSNRSKYGSTGLGMAITKRIVDMMNGTISVQSEKGVGTEFTVVVTLKNSEQQDEGHESSIEPGRIHVLIVDDEEYAADPIIALTANAFDEDVQRSLQFGMNAHLTKPVEPEHLFRTLGELIWENENRNA